MESSSTSGQAGRTAKEPRQGGGGGGGRGRRRSGSRRRSGNSRNRQGQGQGNENRSSQSGGGGNRSSHQHRNNGGQQRSGGGRRRSNRRRPEPPKPTLWQKILSALTFGLLGQPTAPKPYGKKAQPNRKPEDKPSVAERKPTAPETEEQKSKRVPQLAEVTSGRLYVGNLDYEATEADLEELFNGVGTVQTAEVVVNRRTQQSKGFAFVEMSHIDEAKRAVEILHDKDYMGRRLVVSGAKSEGVKGDEDEPGEEEESQD